MPNEAESSTEDSRLPHGQKPETFAKTSSTTPDGLGPGGPRRPPRRVYAGRDLTQGSVPKNLWFLAWPQALEGVVNALDQVADVFWVGQAAGFRAIAGIGAAQAYSRLVMTARNGLDVGMQAMVARTMGRRDYALANHVALQGITLTIFTSVMIAAGGALLAEVLLRLLGVSEAVIALSLLYLQLLFVSAGFQAVRQSTGAALQASGNAITPMKATLLTRVVHLVASPVLIFGWLGLPEMGVAGAGAANVVSQALGACVNVYALLAGTSRLRLTLRGYRPDFPLLCRMVRISAPAAGTQMERGLAELVLARLVTPFGDAALAAYSLTRRFEQLTNLGSMGLGRASGVLVGQSLGAGEPGRARQTVKWALGYVGMMRGTWGVLLLVFPAFFVGIFSSDPQFVAIAVVWVQIEAIAGVFLGFGQVFQQSFNVAGDTLAPLLVAFIAMWVFEVPGAFLLSQLTPLGTFGIPIAITTAMVLRALMYWGYYFSDRWLRARVL